MPKLKRRNNETQKPLEAQPTPTPLPEATATVIAASAPIQHSAEPAMGSVTVSDAVAEARPAVQPEAAEPQPSLRRSSRISTRPSSRTIASGQLPVAQQPQQRRRRRAPAAPEVMVAPAAAAVEPATPEPGPRRSARLRGQQSQAIPPPLSRNTEQADQGQGGDRLSSSSSASQAQDLAKEEDEAGEDGDQDQEQQEQEQEKEEEGGEDEDEDGDEEADAGGHLPPSVLPAGGCG